MSKKDKGKQPDDPLNVNGDNPPAGPQKAGHFGNDMRSRLAKRRSDNGTRLKRGKKKAKKKG